MSGNSDTQEEILVSAPKVVDICDLIKGMSLMSTTNIDFELLYKPGADPGYVKRGGRDPKGGGAGGWYNPKIAPK